MGLYRDTPEHIAALVRDTEVHKACYIDADVFALEMEQLFANTWVYVGHASQVPNAGDFYSTTVGDQPVVMVRHTDGTLRVLHNRCAHKGVQVAPEGGGNTGKFFRCPYHAWTYRTDGRLLNIPLREGYENAAAAAFSTCEASRGMAPVGAVKVYRDFVFCRLNPQGMGFEEFFGESLSTIDNMVDRSPVGQLEVAGGVMRYMHRCNWKMLVDNQTDTCHPMVAHQSSAGTAVRVWQAAPEGTPKPMAVEQFAPFMNPYEFFEKMGIRVWENGHGHTGVSDSIHAAYSPVPGYWESMAAAYGEERAKTDPRRSAAQHRVLPQHHGEGADPDAAALPAHRGRQDAGRVVDLPARRRARPAARAHADVQPARQRAHFGGRPRRPGDVRTRADRRCVRAGATGSTSGACTTLPNTARPMWRRTAPTNGRCATRCAPGCGS